MTAFAQRVLGSTLRRVGALGLGSSFGVGGRDLERAFERGVGFFLWGTRRTPQFGRGLRQIARKDRERATIAIQTYARAAALVPRSVERALRALETDYVDLLCLGWWNDLPPQRILDRALALRDAGKVRHLMVSCHQRATFADYISDGRYDALMVRYNAAHVGAETEVFPRVEAAARRPGVVAYTATRWGTLMDERYVPSGERTPTAADCYRFVLTDPRVDVCLCGPADGRQLDEAIAAIEQGPMSDDEVTWMRRVGVHVRAVTKREPHVSIIGMLDWLATRGSDRPRASAP